MTIKRDKKMPAKVVKVLRRIIPICKDLTVDEQAWITSVCMRYLVMRIEATE